MPRIKSGGKTIKLPYMKKGGKIPKMKMGGRMPKMKRR